MAQLNIHLVLQTPSTDYNGSIWLSFVWNTVYPCLQVFPDVKKKAVSRSGKQVNVYLGLVKKSVTLTVTSSADHGSYATSSYANHHSLFRRSYCQAGILNFSILNHFPVTLISTNTSDTSSPSHATVATIHSCLSELCEILSDESLYLVLTHQLWYTYTLELWNTSHYVTQIGVVRPLTLLLLMLNWYNM